MSDSVQPHRRQLTRLPCPWDSPGKNTGVGCHFLLQCMKVKRQWHPTPVLLPGTHPREYQIVRLTQRKPLYYKTQHHPITSSTLCRTPHPNNKQNYKPNHQQTGLPPHSALLTRGKTKKKTQHKSHLIQSLHKPLDKPLGGQKPKGRKNSTLKPGKRRPQIQ